MLINQDPAKIIDELSVLNVEILQSEGELKNKNIDNFTSLARQIIDNIGKTKYDEILSSDEYHNLYKINLDIFLLVGQLNNLHKIRLNDFQIAQIGININQLNFARFKAKKKLQEKFFNNTEINEIKIGYQ